MQECDVGAPWPPGNWDFAGNPLKKQQFAPLRGAFPSKVLIIACEKHNSSSR